MRVCQISDFKSRGLIFDDSFEKRVKNRLCPNITDDNKDHMNVRNLYDDHKDR